MAERLPLSTLLSQALVAFTIEFDNEFERQMPHRTTRSIPTSQTRGSPWLVSMVMWSNLMRLVTDDGVSIVELQRRARTTNLSLTGMQRWGYIIVAPDPTDPRPKPPRSAWLVRPTAKGRMAQEVWKPLFGVIEKRWGTRFGREEMKKLGTELQALVSQFDIDLPEYLPVVGYGLVAELPPRDHASPVSAVGEAPGSHLAALLSKVLLAFTIHFESESEISLAMSANIIRLIGEKGVRIRDLPRLAGVSKEAIKVSLGFLEKRGYLTVEADPTSARSKVVRLTTKGRKAREAYLYRLKIIEESWQKRFGKDHMNNLRNSLERLVIKTETGDPLLFQGLDPHPDGWRASAPKPESLPHHPMVLHRGGFPDGS